MQPCYFALLCFSVPSAFSFRGGYGTSRLSGFSSCGRFVNCYLALNFPKPVKAFGNLNQILCNSAIAHVKITPFGVITTCMLWYFRLDCFGACFRPSWGYLTSAKWESSEFDCRNGEEPLAHRTELKKFEAMKMVLLRWILAPLHFYEENHTISLAKSLSWNKTSCFAEINEYILEFYSKLCRVPDTDVYSLIFLI